MLHFLQALQAVAHHALLSPSVPLRTARAVWLALSDLSLRAWASQAPDSFRADARSGCFAALVAPVVGAVQHAAHNVQSAHAHGVPSAADTGVAVARCAVTARDVVDSYWGSSKPVRGASTCCPPA